MKKAFLFLLSCMLSGNLLMAQVTEGEIEFNKVKRTVKQMEINYAPEYVEQAVTSRMTKAGYKPSQSKGWLIFKGVIDPAVSSETSDLYVKVDRKGRRDKDVSVVSFFTSKPSDHTVATAMSASMLGSDGESFFTKLTQYSRENKLEKEILDQEETVKKSQKKYDDLVKDQTSLEKKIKDLQSDLESNKQKQESQKKDLENLQKSLEALKLQRSPVK